MNKRRLGQWDVSPLGMGCWAIGGPFWAGKDPLGWGEVDDAESIRAIHAGLDAGITFMDTADVYGAGHSERVIAQALEGRRDQVFLATKFGLVFDETNKQVIESNASPAYIESAVENSLKRLNTDYIDLLWFHLNDYPCDQAASVADTLEGLVKKGKLRSYGWSTDFPDRAAVFAQYPNCAGFQFEYNVLVDSSMMPYCDEHDFSGVIRGPLAMGLLSGKYSQGAQLSDSDIRKISPDWMKYFHNGVPSPELVSKFDAIYSILTSDGRTPVQGALAWLWAKSERTIPIPGFRTEHQILETAGAMESGPLAKSQLADIESLIC